MARTLALLAALLLAASARAELAITRVQLSEGAYGPRRTSNQYLPREEVFVRFLATGLRVDSDSNVKGVFSGEVVDSAGKTMIERSLPLSNPAYCADSLVPPRTGEAWGWFVFSFSDERQPGAYTLRLTVRDSNSGAETKTPVRLVLEPSRFAVVSPRRYWNTEEAPATWGPLVEGQACYFAFRVVGGDGTPGKSGIEAVFDVTDASGTVLRRMSGVSVPEPGKAGDYLSLVLQGGFPRSGEYRIQLRVKDVPTGRTAVYEVAVRVVPLAGAEPGLVRAAEIGSGHFEMAAAASR